MTIDITKHDALIIDARTDALGGLDINLSVLGLTLIDRLVLAAKRAGFQKVQILADDISHVAVKLGLRNASGTAVTTESVEASSTTAIVPAQLLGEVPWLSYLREKGELPVGPDAPLVLTGQSDFKAAENQLLSRLVKETDGFMSRKFARPISLFLSRRLAPMGITPNQMTFVCMLIGLVGAPFFLSADPIFQAIGGLLFVAHSVTDGCDGELARLTYTKSRFGGLFDFASDNLVHVCVFGCMAWGWHINTGSPWPLYFGLGALVGTIGSAAAVYWLTMRKKSGSGPLYTSVSASDDNKKLSKMLDDLSRRDFIYLVFAMAVFGQAHWFVAMTGIGAPIFLILVIVLAVKNARPSQDVMP